MSELKTKISAWLNDKNNNENDLIDFLVEECGVILKEKAHKEEEDYDCYNCGIETNGTDNSKINNI